MAKELTRKEKQITELYFETTLNVGKNADNWISFLKRASFNYDNFDEKGRYIPNSKLNSLKSKGKFIIEKGIGENDIVSPTIDNNECFETNETLKMILGIQSIILKFIKDNSN